MPTKNLSGNLLFQGTLVTNGGPNNGALMTQYPDGDDGWVPGDPVEPEDPTGPTDPDPEPPPPPPPAGEAYAEFTGSLYDAVPGFTKATLSADTRTIYVSATGNDANDGLSEATPVNGHTRVWALQRPGYPDHIRFKRGDTWRNFIFVDLGVHRGKGTGLASGPSMLAPVVVGFYGASGARPRFENDNEIFNTWNHPNLENVLITGLEFSAWKMDPDHPDFNDNVPNGTGDAKFALRGAIRNVILSDLLLNHIEITGEPKDTLHPIDLTLEQLIFTGHYNFQTAYGNSSRPSNVYFSTCDGLNLIGCVFDFGGWYPNVLYAAANQYNHNVYLAASNKGNRVVCRDNIVVRGSSHGIHGRPGGVYEHNFFARNAIGLQMGYNNSPLAEGTFARAYDNVITEGHSMYKGEYGDTTADWLTTRALWGLVINEPGQGAFEWRRNLVAHRSPVDTQYTARYTSLSAASKIIPAGTNLVEEANIFYKFQTTTEGVGPAYADPNRTLATYGQFMFGDPSFDNMMIRLKERPLRGRNTAMEARAINKYIRDGFKV